MSANRRNGWEKTVTRTQKKDLFDFLVRSMYVDEGADSVTTTSKTRPFRRSRRRLQRQGFGNLAENSYVHINMLQTHVDTHIKINFMNVASRARARSSTIDQSAAIANDAVRGLRIRILSAPQYVSHECFSACSPVDQ